MSSVSQFSTVDIPALQRPLRTLMDLDQAVLDAVPMGIYACDASGLILRANRRAVALWGQSPSLMDPQNRFCGSFRIQSLDGQIIAPNQSPMARAVMYGENADGVEAAVLNPDGRRWIARVFIEVMRDAEGQIVGAINCFQDVTAEHEMRVAAERQRLTFDLAMIASQMGTWRYSLADNICVYDENAQRLYGLTEARFLHDEDGVKAKFHPDDMPLMWARVAKALDPNGDGRYDVEYRVKQRDGAWRWLSAWGLVEYEGHGDARKAIAIAGASRDLTERKKAEDLQRLLLGELNHRVKNTLAIVQSLASQTFRGASDMVSAARALDARIISLSRAHDLLTQHSWTGADFKVLVARVVQPFAPDQMTFTGPPVGISPRHVLGFSMTLHELVTNASKYGALSCPEGRLHIAWDVRDGYLHLNWRESHGPAVMPPTRKGFGTRLLEGGVLGDLGGSVTLNYAVSGFQCAISAPLSVSEVHAVQSSSPARSTVSAI